MQSKAAEFSQLRSIFWPIHGAEIKKFLPMGLMMFFILFAYTILRDTKDTLIVNAAGAEALSLIKLIGTVPGAIVVMLIYSKLSNLLSREHLFYATLLPFGVFFGLFGWVIYPNRELIHPAAETIQALQADFPRLGGLFAVYGCWSYALFYVLSELWGSVILSLLFWQFANEIVRMAEAKRFYSMFGLIANVALIVSGYTVMYFSRVPGNLSEGVDPWGMTLNYLMAAVVAAGLAASLIYRWIARNVLTDTRHYNPEEPKGPKKAKAKLSLMESLSMLIRSKHLGLVALIVIFYGISQNIVEAVWKGQIKIEYPNENAYNEFMGRFSMVTGLITMIFMIIGTNIVRLFGWRNSALLTPAMIAVTGLLFFTFVNFKEDCNTWATVSLGMTATMAAIWIGFSQNVLSKATKYSLFDPTKEMCYIPLDQESKIKGKAAVEMVRARLGKSGGPFLQQTLFQIFPGAGLAALAPILGVFVVIVVAAWFVVVRALDKSLTGLQDKYRQKGEDPAKAKVPAAGAAPASA